MYKNIQYVHMSSDSGQPSSCPKVKSRHTDLRETIPFSFAYIQIDKKPIGLVGVGERIKINT